MEIILELLGNILIFSEELTNGSKKNKRSSVLLMTIILIASTVFLVLFSVLSYGGISLLLENFSLFLLFVDILFIILWGFMLFVTYIYLKGLYIKIFSKK